MIIRKSVHYIIAYASWVVTILVGLWFVILARSAYQSALVAFYVRGSLAYAERARFYDQVLTLVLGLLWLALMVVTEWYFRTRALRPDRWKRFARIAGPLLLLVFVADLFLFWLQGVPSTSWLRWLVLAGELVIGIVLLVGARRLASPSSTTGS